MDLVAAIKVLRGLIGQCASLTHPGGPVSGGMPFRVTQIDLLAPRANRCVIGRTMPDGTYESLRRPVADVTADRKYSEADAILANARVEEVRAAM